MLQKLAAKTNRSSSIGTSRSDIFFQFREHSTFNVHEFLMVLSGRLAGCMFRGANSTDACRIVANNFWNSSFRKARDADAAGYYAGTYHFKKPLEQYLDEAAKSEEDLPKLFDGTENLFERFVSTVRDCLKAKGIEFRQAMHGNRPASSFIVRSLDHKSFCPLAAHEDVAQCYDPRQQGFEIQRVVDHDVIAVNFCLENGSGGELSYFNLKPHQEGRRILGLLGVGLPYPDEVLSSVDKIVMSVEPGDIYCFNGGFVHSVGAHIGARRSTISFFLGHIDPATVVYWS